MNRFYLAHYRNGLPLGKNIFPMLVDDVVLLEAVTDMTVADTESRPNFSRWLSQGPGQ